MPRLRALALGVALGIAATTSFAACSPGYDPIDTTTGLVFAADPSSLLLALGEQQTVTVNSAPIGPVAGTVTWTSSDPRVATVDSIVAIGAPATVRAVAPGTVTLRATVASTGNQVLLTVPVRVRTN